MVHRRRPAAVSGRTSPRATGHAFARPEAGDLGELIRLAIPVVVVQVGLMSMGVVDTLMVGRLSAADLAAVALGNLYFFLFTIFGMGVLLSLDPVVSQAVGARDDEAVARGIQRGLLLAGMLGIVTASCLVPAGPLLTAFRQPEEVVPLATGYAHAVIPGVFAFLGFVVFRQTLQAMGRLRAIVIAVIVANLVNVLLNWTLVLGHFGAPRMGAVGTGWASSISRWTLLAVVLFLARGTLRPLLLPLRPEVREWAPIRRMLVLGSPIGFQLFLEYGAFAFTGLVVGLLGTIPMASHQVAINLASLTFMVPLGIGQATAVLVGRAVGRQDSAGARRAATAGLVLGGAFMTTSAAIFLLAPGGLARLYTSEAAVVLLASSLIPIAGIFQVSDGLQVVAAGILRGVGDTRVPAIANAAGFWVLGIPVGLLLAFRGSQGTRGLWWGLAVGLGAVAIFLVGRVGLRLRGTLARVDPDRPREPDRVDPDPYQATQPSATFD